MKQDLEKMLLDMKRVYQKAQIGIANDFLSAVDSLADSYIKAGVVTFIEAEEIKKRILKDLPWANKGQVVYADETVVGGLCAFSFRDEDDKKLGVMTMTSNQFYDWFEEVDERWKPKHGEKYWLLENFADDISDWVWRNGKQYPEQMYSEGRIFRTRELAEQAAEQIKALLKEFHKKNP